MSPETFFIGDIHGCFEELKELIDILNISSGDQVIILGDMINRGPYQAQTLEFIYRSGFKAVMGNHELDYINRHGTEPRYMNLRKSIQENVHDWIMNLPPYIETEDYIAVHAGLEPGRKPSQSSIEILTEIRTWDGKGINLRDPLNPPWYEFYSDTKLVVYGHWAKAGVTIRHNTAGIDSGCVYGNYLTAFEAKTRRLTQVKARRIYHQPAGLMY